MTPTHCPNCGAAMTEENNGKYCLYCGGKLPEIEQSIINNYNNQVENHYHTANVYNITSDNSSKDNGILPESERVKEKRKDKIPAIIIGVVIVILGIASKVSFLIILGGLFINFGLLIGNRINYCPYCYHHKELNSSKCYNCGKSVNTGFSSMIIALLIDAVLIFIAFAVTVN